MTFRVLLIGGGSGGHVYPLIAVSQALRAQAQARGTKIDFLVMGDDGFLATAAKENGLRYRHIFAGKFRRYFSPMMFLDLFKIPIGCIQSLWYVYWYMPNVIFSKGGYDSVPPAIAGKLYFIPLYIHESDSYPGLANSFLARFAKKIFISFQTVAQYLPGRQLELVGNPVRQDLLGGNREEALQAFSFDPNRKTILVIGGSQGAKQINDVILASLVRLAPDYQIIHQCGDSQKGAVQAELDRLYKEGEGKYADIIRSNYRLYSFLSATESKNAYAAADIIVSRAGAGSIFEIAAVGKPAIIIPLHGAAGNHQFLNAVEFAKAGAVVVEGDNITPNVLMNQIQSLLEPERYAQVSQQIKSFARLDAADKIAEAILSKG